MCRKCGPFPTEQLVIVPPSGTGVKRAIAVALLAGAGAIVTLYLKDKIGPAWHAAAVVCVIVGFNLWRMAGETAEKCPTCGSRGVVRGESELGKVLYARWKVG